MTFLNRYFDKNRLKALVLWSLTRSGEKKTIDLVENLKDLGFHYATQAGLSLSIDDLNIPSTKPKLILEAELIVESSQKEYEIGNLTIIERFQQMIDVWHRTSEVLKQNVIQNFKSTNILNPVYMMAFSGARGNISQVRQLVGMRGLMADPQGQILDFPIRSNFREGLTLTEYVISCYGARKGLVDTALRTANSGYLTRRLVDVAQHIIVRQLDCGTTTGIFISDMKDGKKTILSLHKRLIGRVLAESIESIAVKNQDISPSLAAKIVKIKKQVLVRSPLTCEAKNSVCQLCYGWSLAHANLVSLGEAVGILAAQSIGEPGTQLTMRTFHTGGVFSGDVMQEIRSPISGQISFSSPLQGTLIRTLHGKIAFFTKIEGDFSIINLVSNTSSPISYHIPTASILFARQLEHVEKRQLLAEFSSFIVTKNQGIQAKYNLNSEKEGQIYFENVLLVVKVGKEGDLLRTSLKFGSIWILAGKLYESPIRSNLFNKSGDLIDTKSIVNESILVTPYTGFFDSVDLKKEKLINEIFKIKQNISTENSRKNEILFLNKLLSGEKKLLNSLKNYSLNKQNNKTKELILKHPIGTLFIKSINYKKFGYFISLECFEDITFFSTKGIFNNPNRVNDISFYFFDKKNLKKSSLYYPDKNKNFYQKGQYFFISQNVYKLPTKYASKDSKISFLKHISKKQYLKKEKILIYVKNLQGNQEKLKSKSNQFLEITTSLVENTKVEKQRIKLKQITKKRVIYKENPYRKEFSILKKYILFDKDPNKINYLDKKQSFQSKEIKLYFYKKCLLPASNFLNFFTLKKKDFLQPVNSLKLKEEKVFINIKLKLESGWIALPTTNSNFFFLNNTAFRPGNNKVLFQFDQNFSFFKLINLKESVYFLEKKTSLKKIRYISNKFSKMNKKHEKSKFSKKNTILILQKNIVRNKIYLINFYLETNLLSFRKKLNELTYKNKTRKKFILQKFSNNLYFVKFYKINSFLCNKQKNTKIKPTNQSIYFEIKDTWMKKQSNFSTPTRIIFFKNSQNNPLKQVTLDFTFPINLNIVMIRKVNLCTFLVPKNSSSEKLRLTKQKAILEEYSLSFHSFSSSYSGEITSTKTDITGKQKSLLLTKNDQLNFISDQKNSLIKIGQLLRYGDRLNSKTAIQESGQIIQIDKNKITLRKAKPILFSSKGVFHVDNGDIVEKNTPLITLFYQNLKTEDIVQGIPKIEELFEARQTKEGETLQENLHTKLHLFFNYYKQQLTSQEAARKSIEKIQQILVNNVQKVYQSQGVTIADKHIEIIVRQMTTKVKIIKSGRTGLLRSELIDLEWVEIINLGIEAQNELIQQGIKVEKAEYEPIILGITKAALETESFISASSFQETTRILSKAAIERKTDFLRGLKENVILGHLIPAGTGFRLSFNPQFKIIKNKKKLSWLSYKDIIKSFL